MRLRFWHKTGLYLILCITLFNLPANQSQVANASRPKGIPLEGPGIMQYNSVQPFPVEMLNFTAVSAGDNNTCAITTGSVVKCWGGNAGGQLGDGTTIDRYKPVDVIGLGSGILAVSGSGAHTCALTAVGGVKCWGWNAFGQLGDGTITQRNTPVDVIGLTSGVTAIAAGGSHTCALMASAVKCWGDNRFGQLGDGSWNQSNEPVNVIGLPSGMTAIAAVGDHTCGLTAAGGMKCWGWNDYGQLGDGTITLRNTPIDVVGLASGVIAIAAGGSHTCALTSGRAVKCWGENNLGQLGDGTNLNRNTPVDVIGQTSGVRAIGTGWLHSCAVTAGGGTKCWGFNYYGQLGDGTMTDRNTPIDVVELSSGVITISLGGSLTCALMASEKLKCWGSNEHGELGDNFSSPRNLPVDVVGLYSNITKITAGYSHTCSLTVTGEAMCWGENTWGQLGDNSIIQRSTPVEVIGLGYGVIAITAGRYHTCALTASWGAKCWGWNISGQLGDGTWMQRNTPVDVVGLGSGVAAISAGGLHTCALTSSAGVKCWGQNNSGQLGDGTYNWRTTPVGVVGLSSGVSAVTAGYYHTCALTATGGVKCWGENQYGQLGDGTLIQSNVPVDVLGLSSGVISITAGERHTCALTTNSVVKCWGANDSGQLGDGTWSQSNIAVDVIDMASGVTSITASGYHTCALVAGGARCWGENDYGQLGDGTWSKSNIPVDVAGMASGVSAIATGKNHTCVLAGSGRMNCWGLDGLGQLGIGAIVYGLTPIDVVECTSYLTFNYIIGQPGTFFTITGWNFPPGGQATLSINGQEITTTLPVNPTGSFIFFLNTTGDEAGSYDVEVNASGSPVATAMFFLVGSMPQRIQEGGGQTYVVPSGIAKPVYSTYLTMLRR
jgi:alpha-tubulin suppressor-like RCC1 family protein